MNRFWHKPKATVPTGPSDFDRACEALGLDERQKMYFKSWLETTRDTRAVEPSYDKLIELWEVAQNLLNR